MHDELLIQVHAFLRRGAVRRLHIRNFSFVMRLRILLKKVSLLETGPLEPPLSAIFDQSLQYSDCVANGPIIAWFHKHSRICLGNRVRQAPSQDIFGKDTQLSHPSPH